MLHTLVGPLPRHCYCYAERSFFRRDGSGYEPVVWFGLVSHPARAFGCTVMTEEGAVYRNLPPHALAFSAHPDDWSVGQAQRWNCYGHGFTALEYPYLYGLRCRARVQNHEFRGDYLFSVAPVGDGFSEFPEQAKEFTFVALDNGRLTIQPTNAVLFEELSFTRRDTAWPCDLVRQTEVYWTPE